MKPSSSGMDIPLAALPGPAIPHHGQTHSPRCPKQTRRRFQHQFRPMKQRVFTPSNKSVLRLITNPDGSCNSCHQTCKGERAKVRHWLIHLLEEYAEMTKGRIPWNEGKILNSYSKVNIAAACVSECPRCRGSKLFGRKDSYLRHLERKHEINDRGEKNKEVKRLGNESWTDAGARRAVWRLCHSI
ncbi:hypothetical protein K439DRAFT_1638907 [Ramaria rubella]|nr:hypothetical protein K439DRAFT_1638907 [Ramaria rubella]